MSCRSGGTALSPGRSAGPFALLLLGTLVWSAAGQAGPGAAAPAPSPAAPSAADAAILGGFLGSLEDGTQDTLAQSWVNPLDMCTEWAGVSCDETGHVTALNLAGRRLTGTLPSQLVGLDTLRTLNLTDNDFYGELPELWAGDGQWPGLTNLLLARNPRLDGTLPAAWATVGSFASLMVLDMSECGLQGPPPVEWGTEGAFPQLTTLNVSRNQLKGELPSSWSTAGAFYVLKTLSLSYNAINGSLPAQWGAVRTALPRLQLLDLAHNNITGMLPGEWGNSGFKVLTTLQLQNNSLNGTLPPAWGNSETYRSLTSLQLWGNYFSGPFPQAWSLNNSFPMMKELVLKPGNTFLCGPLGSPKYSVVQYTGLGAPTRPTTLAPCPSPAPPPLPSAPQPARVGSLIAGVESTLPSLAVVPITAPVPAPAPADVPAAAPILDGPVTLKEVLPPVPAPAPKLAPAPVPSPTQAPAPAPSPAIITAAPPLADPPTTAPSQIAPPPTALATPSQAAPSRTAPVAPAPTPSIPGPLPAPQALSPFVSVAGDPFQGAPGPTESPVSLQAVVELLGPALVPLTDAVRGRVLSAFQGLLNDTVPASAVQMLYLKEVGAFTPPSSGASVSVVPAPAPAPGTAAGRRRLLQVLGAPDRLEAGFLVGTTQGRQSTVTSQISEGVASGRFNQGLSDQGLNNINTNLGILGLAPAPAPAPQPSPSPIVVDRVPRLNSGGGASTAALVGGVLGGVLALALLAAAIALCLFYRRRRAKVAGASTDTKAVDTDADPEKGQMPSPGKVSPTKPEDGSDHSMGGGAVTTVAKTAGDGLPDGVVLPGGGAAVVPAEGPQSPEKRQEGVLAVPAWAPQTPERPVAESPMVVRDGVLMSAPPAGAGTMHPVQARALGWLSRFTGGNKAEPAGVLDPAAATTTPSKPSPTATTPQPGSEQASPALVPADPGLMPRTPSLLSLDHAAGGSSSNDGNSLPRVGSDSRILTSSTPGETSSSASSASNGAAKTPGQQHMAAAEMVLRAAGVDPHSEEGRAAIAHARELRRAASSASVGRLGSASLPSSMPSSRAHSPRRRSVDVAGDGQVVLPRSALRSHSRVGSTDSMGSMLSSAAPGKGKAVRMADDVELDEEEAAMGEGNDAVGRLPGLGLTSFERAARLAKGRHQGLRELGRRKRESERLETEELTLRFRRALEQAAREQAAGKDPLATDPDPSAPSGSEINPAPPQPAAQPRLSPFALEVMNELSKQQSRERHLRSASRESLDSMLSEHAPGGAAHVRRTLARGSGEVGLPSVGSGGPYPARAGPSPGRGGPSPARHSRASSMSSQGSLSRVLSTGGSAIGGSASAPPKRQKSELARVASGLKAGESLTLGGQQMVRKKSETPRPPVAVPAAQAGPPPRPKKVVAGGAVAAATPAAGTAGVLESASGSSSGSVPPSVVLSTAA